MIVKRKGDRWESCDDVDVDCALISYLAWAEGRGFTECVRDVGNNWNAPLICLFEIVFENMFWFLASVQAQNNNNDNNSRNNSNNNNYIANSSLLYGSSAARAFRQCACRVVAAAPSNVGVIAGLARPRVRVSCCCCWCFSLGTLSCRCGSGFVVRS